MRWAESARRKALHGVADIQTESKKHHEEASESPTYRMNKSGGIIFLDDNDQNRLMVERCYLKRRTTVNPIVDWTDEDVWEFLNEVAKVPHCELYDEPGITRIGCIGCPLQGREGMLEDFERYPRYKELYIRAFNQMIANHPGEIRVATGGLAETNGGDISLPNGSDGALDFNRAGGGNNPQMVDKPLTPQNTTSGCGSIGVGNAPPAIQRVDGAAYMTYWLWRCRNDQTDWSVHPLKGYNPLDSQERITPTRE